MKRKRSLIGLSIAVGLMVALPASVAEGYGERIQGVPVMQGGVIAGDRIVYEGAGVVVVPSVAEAFDSCPSGWVCLFSNIIWGGAMFQISSCCGWVNLADYGFNESASSWRNRKNVDAQIAMNANGGGTKLCLNNGSYSSTMPTGWDNTASSIRVRDASTYC